MVQGLHLKSRFKTFSTYLQVLSLITFICFGSVSLETKAAVLFEGYSKVLSGGVHIGYTISRYEYDSKTKIIKSTYYLRTNALGGNMTESLRATSKADLTDPQARQMIPIGYVYTSESGNKSTLIEASVLNGKLKAKVVKDGGSPENIEKAIPSGAFFSTFLAYVMLKGEKGISTDTDYPYEAIAEEDVTPYKGRAFVKELTEYKGQKAYKVLNEFKEQKFISYASQKGEMLATRSPLQSIETELVATPIEATKGIEVSSENLKLVFGDIPRGTLNSVSAAPAKSIPKASGGQETKPSAEKPKAKDGADKKSE